MEWNPIPHTQHAWNKATTVWGKVALVLFYSYIWLGIISAIWQLVDPTSFGMGCYIDMYAPDPSRERIDFFVTIRSIDILFIGLLLYADFMGFVTKNVALLTVITIAWEISMIPAMGPMVEGHCTSLLWQFWINPVWMILSLICMVIEDKLGDRADEGYTEISA